MGKFAEANWRGKASLVARYIKSQFRALVRPTIPNSPITLVELYKMESGYQSMRRSTEEIVNRIVLQEFASAVGGSVLDVPCGSGAHLDSFLGSDLSYFGMDISEKAIAVAQLKHPRQTFINLSIYDAKYFFQPEIFDYSISVAMLEHIGNWERAIENLLYLSRKKVVLLFFDGLSKNLQKNYYEFHPFTDQRLVDYEVRDAYGLKPIISNQDSEFDDVHVFTQPGNSRIPLDIAGQMTKLSTTQLRQGKFAFDPSDKTVSLRHILLFSQDNVVDYFERVVSLPNLIEKRKLQKHELGYFMNRFSCHEMESFFQLKGFNYRINDAPKRSTGFASFVTIEK